MNEETEMHPDQKNQYKSSIIKIQSKIQSQIYHNIEVNLYCDERMPTEKELRLGKKSNKTKNSNVNNSF